MKRIILLLTVMLSIASCGAADNFELTMRIDNPVMTVNGAEKDIDAGRGTAPIIINERTLVPIRAVIAEMGGAVYWEDDTQNVILALGENIIMLTIDSETAFLNGDAKKLDTAPSVIDGRTMLPIRFISESLGYKVDWNSDTMFITITQN